MLKVMGRADSDETLVAWNLIVSVPLAAVLGRGALVLPCLLMAALIILRHRANIARIRAGTEPRIGRRG